MTQIARNAPPGSVHGLVPALTSFVGRADAVAAVAGLLGQYRLVTVTGPGGVGKPGWPARWPGRWLTSSRMEYG